MAKTKSTISISLEKSQIAHIDRLARQERIHTGENVTRSQIVRRIVDGALASDSQHIGPTPTPPTGTGGFGERSDARPGETHQWQED